MALSNMWLLYYLPSIVLQLLTGPYMDKWSRKWMMVFALWSRAVIFLIPIIGAATNALVPWHIYAVQIGIGLITPLYVPANQAILPSIVSMENLKIANAYVDGIRQLMTFLAPMAAGVIILCIGSVNTLVFACMLLVISGGLLLGIREKRPERVAVKRSWSGELKEGITYFFKQKVIVWLGIFMAFVQFGVGVAIVINLPYIVDVLNKNVQMYGYFMAGFPLGYVVGTLIVGKMSFLSRRILMLGALLIGGLTYINLGVTNSITFAITTEVIAGIAMACFSIHNITICQQTVPDHLRGKVFTIRSLIIRAMMPLGIWAGGIMSVQWGIRPLYIIIGVIIFLTALIGLVLPYFRFINEPSDNGEMAS